MNNVFAVEEKWWDVTRRRMYVCRGYVPWFCEQILEEDGGSDTSEEEVEEEERIDNDWTTRCRNCDKSFRLDGGGCRVVQLGRDSLDEDGGRGGRLGLFFSCIEAQTNQDSKRLVWCTQT